MAKYKVAAIGEIPAGKSKVVEIEGKEVAVFHDQGTYYAVLNVCPHARAPLAAGRIEGLADAPTPDTLDYRHDQRVLRCPWHHWEFELESGKAVCNVRHRIVKFPVEVEDGNVYVVKGS